jgi:hypothetical protein
MKGSRLMGAVVIALAFSSSGCMMMHGGDMMGHGSHDQTQKDDKVAEGKIEHGQSETDAESSPLDSDHNKESTPQEGRTTWLILGVIGMGLMMILMFI